MLGNWSAVPALDLFDDVMRSAFGTATSSRSFTPDIDVRVDDDRVVFHCDVPGLSIEDLDVTLANGTLTLKGARKFEGTRDKEQIMLGRPYGAFERSFALPDAVDAEHLSARLANGVLTLEIPKSPKAKPRRIEIRDGGAHALSDGTK